VNYPTGLRARKEYEGVVTRYFEKTSGLSPAHHPDAVHGPFARSNPIEKAKDTSFIFVRILFMSPKVFHSALSVSAQ
jgi:hypothetical protein